MGEEEKKAEENKMEEKKAEEAKKAAGEEKEEEDNKKQSEKTGEPKKPEESKEGKETKETKEQTPPLPPPPQEIVLKVYMHCEGCARKVRKSLKGFQGVEDVVTDCRTHKVVVKGEKADPVKVLERVQRKSHRQVELISPIPKPPSAEEKKPEEKEKPKAEEKKEEPQIVTVVLRVHMHCEACAQEIKKRILRMKEVESAEPDLKNSEVTVKGTFEPSKLVEYVYKRTGKHAVIIKQDPEKKEKSEEAKESKEEKKSEGSDEKEKKGSEVEIKEKKEGDVEAKTGEASAIEEIKVVELKKSEYYYYPQRYAVEMYAYPPQIFSDENPNACSVM